MAAHRLTQALPTSHHDASEQSVLDEFIRNFTAAVPGPSGPFDLNAAFSALRVLVSALLSRSST